MTALREVWYRVQMASDPNGSLCPPRVESREFFAEPDNKGWRSPGVTGERGWASSVFYATYEPDEKGWGAFANGWRKSKREAAEAALERANNRAASTRAELESALVYAASVEALLVSLAAGEAGL